MKSFLRSCLIGTLVIFIAWLAVASVVFQFRHPWSTDTERLLHIGDALLFRKISYSEMRNR